MDRILTHPILGDTPEGRLVNFTYDGQTLQGIEGEPIAAALRVAGVMTHRYTKKRHEPRGVFCAIGRCTDCVMVVNGKPNIRTCITPLEEGMDVCRTLPIDYYENANVLKLSGENLDGSSSSIVFYSARGIERLKDLTGRGADHDSCGTHKPEDQ